MTNRHVRTGVAGGLALALLASGVTSAGAAEDQVEKVADLVEEVAPAQGAVLPGVERGGSLVTAAGEGRVTVPLDPTSPILLEHDSLQDVTVSLPAEAQIGVGRAADDGTVVYQGVAGNVDAAVQTLADGSVRIQTVIPDARSPHGFTYFFGEGVVPVLTPDGSVDLVESVDGSPLRSIVGVVDQPWAMDANGSPVRTEYEIVGNAIKQTVVADAHTTYPIVADPKVGLGMGFYLYLNTYEARGVAIAAESILMVGGGASCAAYGKRVSTIPGLGTFVSHLCGYVSAAALYKFFQALPARYASYYSKPCYEWRFTNRWTGPKSVASSNCVALTRSWTWM